MWTLLALCVVSVGLVAPVQALDMRFYNSAGSRPGVTDGKGRQVDTLGLGKADATLSWTKPDGSLGFATLLNALPSGRRAVEQGQADDLTVGGMAIPAILGSKAPLSSPAFSGPITSSGTFSAFPVQGTPPTSAAGIIDVRNSALSAEDIIGPTVPRGWFDNIGVRSSIQVDDATTAINTAGFGFYVRNQAVSTGAGKNGVGMFGSIKCVVDGSNCWGLNPALIDADANGAVTTGTGRNLIGMEIDLTATSPRTNIQGIALLGASQTNPAGANGFTCGSLGGPAVWRNCLVSEDGRTQRALYAGAVASSGTNLPSQTISLGYRNAAGQVPTVTLQAFLGALNVTDNTRPNGLSLGTAVAGTSPRLAVTGPDADISLLLGAKGTGAVATGSPFIAQNGASVIDTFTVASNSQDVPYRGDSAIGLAVTGNRSSGGAETDLWNTFPGAAKSFALHQITGSGAFTTVLEVGTSGLTLRSSTFASLPTSAAAGTQLYCSDCREPGQAAGAGTGIPVYRNATGWRSSAGGAAAN